MDYELTNSQECFVQLWLRLERTRRLFQGQYKRFCIRRVLQSWYGLRATDDFIWEVCHLCEQEGWDELPLPSLYPRKHRELLRAIVAVKTGISYYKINLKALDIAMAIHENGTSSLDYFAMLRGWGLCRQDAQSGKL